MKRAEWKDCVGWKDDGLALSTASNAAAKLFDASLTQYVGLYDDDSVGGLAMTLKQIREVDHNFVMGQVIAIGLTILSSAKLPRVDTTFQAEILQLKKNASEQKACGMLTDREELHAEAICLLADGKNKLACDIWQDILVQHPKDILALKFLQDRCLFMGNCKDIMKGSIERILPYWNASSSLYSHLLGIYSFALCETKDFDKSEQTAMRALAMNHREAWSVHTVTHCMEMTDRSEAGVKFLEDRTFEWQKSLVTCHITWHKALFYIEMGMHEEALELYDVEIERLTKLNKSMFNLTDATSLLFRLQLEKIDVARRWNNISEISVQYMHHHNVPFEDIHLCMAYVYGNTSSVSTGSCSDCPKTSEEFMDSLSSFVNSSTSCTDHRYIHAGLAVCNALKAFKQERFSEAVDYILPYEWQLSCLGGSDAQRDVIHQLFIHSALYSERQKDRRLARRLLAERQIMHPGSGLTKRLVDMMCASHADILK